MKATISVLCILWGLVFIFSGILMGDLETKRDAIRHHAAHYDPQTGDFTWNQPEDSK
jgi:hypothetical protein